MIVINTSHFLKDQFPKRALNCNASKWCYSLILISLFFMYRRQISIFCIFKVIWNLLKKQTYKWIWLILLMFKGTLLKCSFYPFRLNWLLFGSVFSFHLTNVVLHSACVVLLLYFCRELLAWRRDAALIAALMFAAHPVHTEAVSKHFI